MATRTWLGTGGTVGAWNVAANWVEGAVPTAADDAYLVSGAQSVSSGLAGANARRLITGPAYSGDIGTPSTSLAITVVDVAVFGGSGAVRVDFGAGSCDVIVRAAGTKVLALKGSADEVLLHRGKVEWDTGTLTRLLVEFLNNQSNDVDLILNSPTVTAAIQNGGSVSLDGAGTLTKWEIVNGSLFVEQGTLTELNEWGGRCVWNTNLTMTTGRIFGGTLDVTQDLRAKTITNLERHSGARVLLNTGSKNVTLTNGLKNFGGEQDWEALRTINYI